jgi:PilZ domain-containing protein
MNVIIAQGRGSELNCGGMAVSGTVELEIGAQVAVEFTPPCSGQPLRVRCFVRNRQCDTYGLEFITENDSDYESVAQVASSLENMGIAVCSSGDGH